MVSHRDHSWILFFSTYTYTICLPKPAGSVPTLTTWSGVPWSSAMPPSLGKGRVNNNNNNNLAILYSSGNLKVLERTLSEDITTLSAYLQTWRLKLTHSKTVSAAFHFHNREVKRELKVKNNRKSYHFSQCRSILV